MEGKQDWQLNTESRLCARDLGQVQGDMTMDGRCRPSTDDRRKTEGEPAPLPRPSSLSLVCRWLASFSGRISTVSSCLFTSCGCEEPRRLGFRKTWKSNRLEGTCHIDHKSEPSHDQQPTNHPRLAPLSHTSEYGFPNTDANSSNFGWENVGSKVGCSWLVFGGREP
ncbi:hypothetical protein Bbelb_000560 [Branchiostoma belcheri]|nr:hypothetical protein Bbelb_000560 [Branchiostoma belcheri]